MKVKVNWARLFVIITSALLMSFIGMALPEMIGRLNNNMAYGIWSSYFVSILLFFLLIDGTELLFIKRKGKE